MKKIPTQQMIHQFFSSVQVKSNQTHYSQNTTENQCFSQKTPDPENFNQNLPVSPNFQQ
jgi:hypothetical protein